MTVRIGVVLGAGGVAGGAFHAGVLAAVEQAMHWDPRTAEILVGTSAGSITAMSLRAGLSASDMFARAEGRPLSTHGRRLMRTIGTTMQTPLQPTSPRRSPSARGPRQIAATLARAAARPLSAPPWALLAGLLPEGSISTEFIADAVGGLFPDAWPAAPLLICAVRQRDGRRIVFGKDGLQPSLPDVVAASCAIPGFFSPVIIDGEAYVDGGLHSPTNADVLSDSGLDLVIVSSPMSISSRQVRLSASEGVRRWAATLLNTEAVRLRRRHIPVIAFQPTAEDAAVMGPNAMDPGRRGIIARQAFESTMRRLSRADTKARLSALGDA